jgi:uncharacterized membrane protein
LKQYLAGFADTLMHAATDQSPTPSPALNAPSRDRLTSIDVFRGLIMVLMALDHTRDFFSNIPFEPENLAQTNLALFVTRWVTHFCAPMFFFLAGTSAFLYGQRKSASGLQHFLWTRGLWLVLLEFTVVGTAWSFQFPWGFFGVIWALGACMLILSLVVRLPMRWITAVSLAMIAGHNLLDGISPRAMGSAGWLWKILHARGGIVLPGGIQEFVLFPLVPLVAVMAAGYAFGQIYLLDRVRRRNMMAWLGLALTVGFVILRLTHLYGNPPQGLGGVSQGDWHVQPTVVKTIILFFDVEKYPPSLQFLLMTVGPSLLLLAGLDREYIPRATRALLIFGRVPMFFYVLHLYFIHWLAIFVASLAGQPVRWLFHGAIFAETPQGYGYGLAFVYLMWITVLVILYFPCRWFAELKKWRKDWWLSYL